MTKAVAKTEGTALSMGTPVDMIKLATEQGAGIDVMEKLVEMYKDEREYQSRKEFNAAMTEAQTEIRPVQANMANNQTHSRYADYNALDKMIRPIYTKHGFGLSFSTGDTDKPEMVRVTCVVSHSGGYEREHSIDMPADGKGAKGNDVMTKTHATGAATTYGMRYLLKMIFNVAIGEDDRDGNVPVEVITAEQAIELADAIKFSGVDMSKVLAFGGVADLKDFPAAKFDPAMATCKKRADKAAK